MTDELEDFLTAEEESQVIEAIRQAELKTSGEIRVHLEYDCHGLPSEDRALQVFDILKMYNTKDRNGVLIYVAVHDHSFVVLGDTGIHKKVGDEFWQSTKNEIQQHFQQHQFALGLTQGITHIGKQLKQFFPFTFGDQDELPNTITTS